MAFASKNATLPHISHFYSYQKSRTRCRYPIGVQFLRIQTEAMERMHVMESDGRMVSGAAAFVAMWRRLPRYRPLAWVVSLPGIFWLAEQAYSRFARWRLKGRCDQICCNSSSGR